MDESKRCRGTKPDGTQCSRARTPGSTVCATHGGSVGRVKAAAGRRLADRQARELGRRADIEVPEFSTPGTAARYLLAQAGARALQFGMLADGAGSAVFTDEAGREQVRAAYAEERRWLELLGRVLHMVVVANAAQADEQAREQAEAQARETIGRLGNIERMSGQSA